MNENVIGENIKAVRKYFKLSRDSFGKKLGVSQDVIANIELNRLARPEAKEPLIKLICKEFKIDYFWLTTGTGNMFGNNTDELKFLAEVDRVLADEDERRKSLIKWAINLDNAQIEEFYKLIESLHNAIKKD